MRVILALLLLFVADQGLATVLGRQVKSLVGKKLSSSMAIVTNINRVDENNRNALHHAVILGDLSLVEFFLDNGIDTKATDIDGLIPLRYAERIAAEQPTVERMKIVSLVLEKTRGINKGDEQGWPPMVWSLMAGDYERVIELRDRGANVFAGRLTASGRGQIAGHQNPVWAAEYLEDDWAIKILAKDAPDYYFPVAVGNRYLKFTQEMIKRGVDINVKDKYGYSAAMRAAKAGRLDDLQMLIDHGAEIDGEVLFFAIHSGSPKLVETILEHNVDPVSDLIATIVIGDIYRAAFPSDVYSVFNDLDKTKGGRRIIRMLESMSGGAPFPALVKLVKQGGVPRFATLANKNKFSGMEQEVQELLSYYLAGIGKFPEGDSGYRQLMNFLAIAKATANDKAGRLLLELLGTTAVDKEKLIKDTKLLRKLNIHHLQAKEPHYEALLLAIKQNDIEGIQKWIDFGLKIDNLASHMNEALLLAIRQNNLEVIQKWIDFGLKINDKHLERLARFGSGELLEFFVNSGIVSVDHLFHSDYGERKVSLMLQAAWADNFSVVEKIISLGGTEGIDRALIHFSGAYDRHNSARIAFAGPFDKDDIAPARARIAKFNEKVLTMMELLIDNGAKVNSISSGQTPLYNAIRSLKVPRVKLLLERGAVATETDIVKGLEDAGFRATRSNKEQLQRDWYAIKRLLER